jgi:hypothetical protein
LEAGPVAMAILAPEGREAGEVDLRTIIEIKDLLIPKPRDLSVQLTIIG